MTPSAAQFVTAEADEAQKRQEVLAILPVKAYLVKFVGADGKVGNRLAFQPEGSEMVFNLQEKISGMHVATQAAAWFKNSFNKKLNADKEVESV
jgi:hypothetical protein